MRIPIVTGLSSSPVMSAVYDNWERLVAAILRREKDRYLARVDSFSDSDSDCGSCFRWESFPGYSFTYRQLLYATDGFSRANLLKHGHSGDLFRGYIPLLSLILAQDNQIRRLGSVDIGNRKFKGSISDIFKRKKNGSTNIVIKRFDPRSDNRKAYSSELNILSTVSEVSRFSLFLGFCQKGEKIYIVYKYASRGDLSSFFPEKGYLQSLDWMTRLKIAIGAAERLVYLHDVCSPSFAHGDVQDSSILLDDEFDVWLGSLGNVCAEGRISKSKWDLIRTYDVYCFGKVLLKLVTGSLGMSVDDLLSKILSYIESVELNLLMDRMDGIETTTGRYSDVWFIDPSLKRDSILMDEVWRMVFIARACLNPRPERRPLMQDVLDNLKIAKANLPCSLIGTWWSENSSNASFISLCRLKNIP